MFGDIRWVSGEDEDFSVGVGGHEETIGDCDGVDAGEDLSRDLLDLVGPGELLGDLLGLDGLPLLGSDLVCDVSNHGHFASSEGSELTDQEVVLLAWETTNLDESRLRYLDLSKGSVLHIVSPALRK